MKIKPLFRWAGGKNKYIKFISPYLTYQDLYIEPFFGGGAIFCYIVNNNLASKFIINDIKQELIDLYIYIQKQPILLLNQCKKYEKNWLKLSTVERKEYYYELRDKYWNNPNSPLLFFLLKTSFNGVWRTCKNSKGLFGTASGLLNEKQSFIDEINIKEWNKVLQNTKILCQDFESITPMNALVYCDPPYRNSFTTYGENFTDDDQLRLLKWCENNSKTNNIVLSNKSDGVFFENNIGHAKIHYFDGTHTAGRRLQIKDKNDKITSYQAKKVKEIIMVW